MSRLLSAPPPAAWLGRWMELSPHFRCNSRCGFCFRTPWLQKNVMSQEQALAVLREGAASGRTHLWVGGGEPTLYKPLPQVLALARELGFERRLIQTNGWALGRVDYLDTLTQAGLTDVRVSVFGAPFETPGYDSATGVKGASGHLQKAMLALAEKGLWAEADLLMHRDHAESLVNTVAWLMNHGVTRGVLWFMSLDNFSPEYTDAPRLSLSFEEATPPLERLLAFCEEKGFDLRVIHLPPCLYPSRHGRYLNLKEWDLTVFTPTGSFAIKDSAMEGGHYVSACGACNLSHRCLGLRHDYLATYGAPQLNPFFGDPHDPPASPERAAP